MKRIAVIGTIFVDIKGFPKGRYIPEGRNTGSIETVHGGVGRNIAENLADCGMPVMLVSSCDEGIFGRDVLERLHTAGVNTDYVICTDIGGTGKWMLLSDENGNQLGSVSSIPDPKYALEVLMRSGDEIMENADSVCLEFDFGADVTEKTISCAEKHGVKVYALPGNMSVVNAHKNLLSGLSCFFCNDIEAGILFETATEGKSADELLRILTDGMKRFGIKSMVMTLGERGAVFCDGCDTGFVPAIPTQAVDTSGAGDALFSGAVAGLSRGLSLGKAVALGTKLASLTIQTRGNNSHAAV